MDRTKLLGNLHAKYLISSRLFTAWLADHLSTANLAQVGFIVQLTTTYLSDMSRHVVNGRICIRAACEKIREVSSSLVARLISDPRLAIRRVRQTGGRIHLQPDQGKQTFVSFAET